VLLVAASGGGNTAQPEILTLPSVRIDSASEREAAALRAIRRDFAARWIPNRWGVGEEQVRIRGYTLEAWSSLPQTRAGLAQALVLCDRLHKRYVVAPGARYGVGQAAVYSRAKVLLTASLRYKWDCYEMVEVS
jgi:hypothetical protein